MGGDGGRGSCPIADELLLLHQQHLCHKSCGSLADRWEGTRGGKKARWSSRSRSWTARSAGVGEQTCWVRSLTLGAERWGKSRLTSD